jgi:hypothetical protein
MGLQYYPKLLTAIPFTPATGPRLLHDPASRQRRCGRLAEQMPRWPSAGISSWHVLFPEEDDAALLEEAGLHTRHQVQFHWFNRGYGDFDDFLDGFASRKRKALRRERRRVAEQGLTVDMRDGGELSARDWEVFHRFYQMTYAKRSGHGGYLTREFFHSRCAALGEQVLLALAREDNGAGEPVAGALYFRDSHTLYGRYWGCSASTTACTSRPATTRASSTASARDCSASTPAPRASTRSSAASSPPPPCPATGSPQPLSCLRTILSEETRKRIRADSQFDDIDLHEAGVIVQARGGRFETAAEIRMFAQWGGDVVTMNVGTEIAYARMLGMNYACLIAISNPAEGVAPWDFSEMPPLYRRINPLSVEILMAALPRIAGLEGKPRVGDDLVFHPEMTSKPEGD